MAKKTKTEVKAEDIVAPIDDNYDFGAVRDLYRTALIELVSIGMSIEDAIEKTNVPAAAISPSLMNELRLIETRLEAQLLKSIVEASADKWSAAAWLLERRFKARWSKAQERGSKELPALIVDVIKDLQ
jgi:hypothetical protein